MIRTMCFAIVLAFSAQSFSNRGAPVGQKISPEKNGLPTQQQASADTTTKTTTGKMARKNRFKNTKETDNVDNLLAKTKSKGGKSGRANIPIANEISAL